jgi:hypothetical protein
VPGHLGLGSFDDELGAVGSVVRDPFLLFRDLRSQRGDEAFFLKFGSDPV